MVRLNGIVILAFLIKTPLMGLRIQVGVRIRTGDDKSNHNLKRLPKRKPLTHVLSQANVREHENNRNKVSSPV